MATANFRSAVSGGLVRWNPIEGASTKYTSDHGLPANAIHFIAVAADKSLLCGSKAGAFLVTRRLTELFGGLRLDMRDTLTSNGYDPSLQRRVMLAEWLACGAR
jgi:hypothetical protein